ncbi:hypothetical protein POTOM_018555 [Populus tomentosa]|uniref:Pentatricopeptide repeat-containing protein n=1 Tax=Populus tomentosa TaxID=118781 RepID=A0A8X7ZVR0_POPTO|nr:hypothetical protein POTOM_018555 [Populus tomentosa]
MVRGGREPDVITYSTITGSLCKDRLVNDAMEFLSEMVDRDIPPDVKWFLRDVMPNTVTFTVLVDGLCKEGTVSEARTKLMRTEKCSTSWLARVVHQRLDQLMDIARVARRMDEENHSLLKYLITYSILLVGFLHTILIEGMFIAGKLEVAKELSSKLFCGWNATHCTDIQCHDHQGTS